MVPQVFFLTDSGKEQVAGEVKVEGKVIHVKSPALVGIFSKKEFRMARPHEEGFIISNGEDILIAHPKLKLKRILRIDGVEDGIKIFLPKPLEEIKQEKARAKS